MQGKVPVGVTSVAGYTVTFAAAVGAVLAFLKGDRSDQTLGVLASAGVAILAFLSTQLGRYAQAHAAVKKQVVVGGVSPVVSTTSGTAAQYVPLGMTNRTAHETLAPLSPPDPTEASPEIPHDFVDEPEDDGSDQVPEHEQRDLHDGGKS